MKYYWDTSAVINAFVSEQVYDRLDQDEHVTRLHTFGEFFAHMTGRGIAVSNKGGESAQLKADQVECAKRLRQFSQKVSFVELTEEEMLDGMEKARSRSILGRGIYDYWHALAANKSKADVVLTRNTGDFVKLVADVKWP